MYFTQKDLTNLMFKFEYSKNKLQTLFMSILWRVYLNTVRKLYV